MTDDEKSETLLGTKFDRALRDAVNERGANCIKEPEKFWFPYKENYVKLCDSCPVFNECRQAGAKNSQAVGVYGGRVLRREKSEELLDWEGNYLGNFANKEEETE